MDLVKNLISKIDNTIIEIVDRYKYLGIVFSQSGSFLNARKHIVQQAKKAMTLFYIKTNNLDIPLDLQIKLFDHTILPILTYGCEVWGYENIAILEKVHNDFLRRITRARKSTPLYMIHGELGRYPIEISIKTRLIGFWNRMIHGKETKLSLSLYQCLLHSNNTVSKWVRKVKNILSEIGRPDIWRQQYTFHLLSLSSHTKKILIDQFKQSWRGKASQSQKALTYFNFKTELCLEQYFITLPRRSYILLFKLRTSNHKLPIEVGRWDGTLLDERTCNLCPLNDLGDEYHFICKCPFFSEPRAKYITPFYSNRLSMFKFCQLLNSNDAKLIRNLCRFIEIILHEFN